MYRKDIKEICTGFQGGQGTYRKDFEIPLKVFLCKFLKF